MEPFDRIKQLIASCEEDLAKAKGGNKAAGVRVRGIMQDVKAAAQEVREAILTLRAPEAGGNQPQS
ncbi:MAG: histone H1 [Phycisphaerales bacterium]